MYALQHLRRAVRANHLIVAETPRRADTIAVVPLTVAAAHRRIAAAVAVRPLAPTRRARAVAPTHPIRVAETLVADSLTNRTKTL